MTLVQKFLDKYTEFETFIRDRNNIGENKEFSILDDKIIAKNIRLWKLYKDLRNLLNHEIKIRNGNYIEITQKLYDDFCTDVDKIMSPKTAYKIAVKQIYTVKETETICAVIKTMIVNNYTCTPVVDDNDKLIGVFSSQSLMQYFNKNEDEIIAEPKEITMKEMIEFCNINDNADIEYRFVSRKEDEYFIKDLFKQALDRGKRLEAVFVTENGKNNEKLLGIITHWDIK